MTRTETFESIAHWLSVIHTQLTDINNTLRTLCKIKEGIKE